MIVLYRDEVSPIADAVAERLRELVVGVTVHVVAPGDAAPVAALPAIVEGRRVVGPAELEPYLDELTAFVEDSRLYQTDACYIDARGQVC